MKVTVACLIFLGGFMAWENDKLTPKPYSLGNGDTLMVKTLGYGFCPKYCEIDHFHLAHFKNYDCGEIQCEHTTINEE